MLLHRLDIVSKSVMVPLSPCLQSGLTKAADYVPGLVRVGAHAERNTDSIWRDEEMKRLREVGVGH